MSSTPEKIVLVADDEEHFRHALVDALIFFDYHVREAKNGDELLTKARDLINDSSHPFFVLVVDNQMPQQQAEDGKDGKEEQWCGLNCIIELTNKLENIHERVLFLSRWGLDDLKFHENQKKAADAKNLANSEHWLAINTPFSVLKQRIEYLFSQQIKSSHG